MLDRKSNDGVVRIGRVEDQQGPPFPCGVDLEIIFDWRTSLAEGSHHSSFVWGAECASGSDASARNSSSTISSE